MERLYFKNYILGRLRPMMCSLKLIPNNSFPYLLSKNNYQNALNFPIDFRAHTWIISLVDKVESSSP